MPPAYQSIRCQRYRTASGWETTDISLIAEANVDLTVNGKTWLSFACTPAQLEALAVGFLYNEGFIQSREEIALVEVCKQGLSVDVWLNKTLERPTHWQRTSGCTGGLTAANQARVFPAAFKTEPISPETVFRCMAQLSLGQELYRETGGVHTSILSDGQEVRVRAEDIGRHNTLDKLAGHMLLDGLQIHPLMVATTGRVSLEMMQKSARLGAVMVLSRTSPTSQSVALAEAAGITLIGYARRSEFQVYTHAERLSTIPAGRQVLLPGGTHPDC